MKLKQYAKHIQKLAEKHPGALVIYSSDDEGNRYEQLAFLPTVGHYSQGDYDPQDEAKDACCVN